MAAFVVGLCLTLIIVVGGYQWLTSPARVAAMVAGFIDQELGGQARVDHALFRLNGPIEIQGVHWHLSEGTGESSKLLEIDQVLLWHKPWSLLRGRLSVREVRVQQPRIYLTEIDQPSPPHFNWERLWSGRKTKGGDWSFKGDLPVVTIESGQWIFARVKAKEFAESARFSFTGSLKARTDRAGVYGFELTQLQQATAEHPAIQVRGWIDPSGPAFMGELLNFDSTRVNPQLLPSAWLSWWEKLNPSGALPTVQLGMNPEDGPWAKIRAHGLSVNLPLEVGMTQLTADQAQLTFGNNTLQIEELSGVIHGCQYSIKGFIREPGDKATLKLEVDLQGPVPHDPQVMELLPPVTRSYLKRFDVRGQFHTQMTIQRERPEDHVISLGALELTDGTLSDSRNPYPMEKVSARIRYDHDAVVIERIDAVGKSGAVIHAQGEIRPPTNTGALVFAITMKGAPLDEFLLGALEEDERKIVTQLVSGEALEKLRRQGVIGTDHQFALDGKVDIKIEIHAPPGSTDTVGFVTTTIDLAGGKMLCDFWPYPLMAQAGQLVVKGGRIQVKDVQLRGLTGGRATLSGELRPDETHPRRVVTELAINAEGIPLDGLLLASLPDDERELVSRLGVTGHFDGKARIYTGESNDITFTIEPQLIDCAAQPVGTNFKLTNMNAKLTLQPALVIIDELGAGHGEGTLNLKGRMSLDDERPAMQLRAGVRNFPLEQGLFELLAMQKTIGADTLATLHQYDPQGIVNGEIEISNLGFGISDLENKNQPSAKANGLATDPLTDPRQGAGGLWYQLKLNPQRLNVRSVSGDGKIWRVAMDSFAGNIQATPQQLQFNDLQMAMDGVNVGVQGKVQWSTPSDAANPTGQVEINPQPESASTTTADLKFTAHGDRLTPGVRSLLPAGLREGLERLEFQGGFTLRDAQLTIQPEAPPVPPAPPAPQTPQVPSATGTKLAWSSLVDLRDASVLLGVPITEINGVLNLTLRQPQADGPMLIELRTQARQMRVLDRLISPLSFQLLSLPVQISEASTSQPPLNTPSTTLPETSPATTSATSPATLPTTLPPKAATIAPDRWELKDLIGDCYGGKVLGSGTIVPGKPGGYSIQLVLDGAALDPLVNPRSDTSTTNGSNGKAAVTNGNKPTGRVSANLALEGVGDDVRSRRGRGELVIREARLFELPLAMTMLQLTHINWPRSRAFDRAAAGYVINGDTVQLKDLSFEAPDLRIFGSGTVQLPGLQMELDMFTRNPHRENWGLLGEAIDLVRDGVMSIKVTGTLDNPKASLQGFTGIRRTWQELFKPGQQ